MRGTPRSPLLLACEYTHLLSFLGVAAIDSLGPGSYDSVRCNRDTWPWMNHF